LAPDVIDDAAGDGNNYRLTPSSDRCTVLVVATRPLLDAEATAAKLGITERHLRDLVQTRRIPFVKVGRLNRFDPDALDVWLEERKVEVTP
jgi:excisionase family DNA binding protein